MIEAIKLEKQGYEIIEVNRFNTLSFTGDMKTEILSIWNENDSKYLLEILEDYKFDFRTISRTRAKILSCLRDDVEEAGLNLTESEYKKLDDMIEGEIPVKRDDIVHLSCIAGLEIKDIDFLLEHSGFALINPSIEIAGNILVKHDLPEEIRRKLPVFRYVWDERIYVDRTL